MEAKRTKSEGERQVEKDEDGDRVFDRDALMDKSNARLLQACSNCRGGKKRLSRRRLLSNR